MEYLVEQSLIKRGVRGDKLLDALDIVDNIKSFNGVVLDNAYAVLFHATSTEKAKKIVKEQQMFGLEPAIYFSTKSNGEISGYGEVVLIAEIPVEKLILDDEFSNEQHYKIKTTPNEKIKIKVDLF